MYIYIYMCVCVYVVIVVVVDVVVAVVIVVAVVVGFVAVAVFVFSSFPLPAASDGSTTKNTLFTYRTPPKTWKVRQVAECELLPFVSPAHENGLC